MAHTYIKRFTLCVALTLLVVAFAADSFAAGTPAGTVISNTAIADYEDANANALQSISNTVTTTVSQVAAVDISPASNSSNADPGDTVCYLHTVTNNGNDSDLIDIATASSQRTWKTPTPRRTSGHRILIPFPSSPRWLT